MTAQDLTLDAWAHVLEHVGKDDLLSLCLVSRSFKAIATRILYRSITLLETYPEDLPRRRIEESQILQSEERGHWHLLSRLENDSDQHLRNIVKTVTLLCPSERDVDELFLDELQKDDRLLKVLASLPNLRRVTIGLPELQTDHLIRTLCTHRRKPELDLKLASFEKCPFTEEPYTCVSELTIKLDPWYERDGQNQRMLKAQHMFFNCPNLRSFNLKVYDKYGGCVISFPRYPITQTFQLTGEEQFPPLEELALNGYRMEEEEGPHWKRNFQWDKLSSLTIGPISCSGLLAQFAGYATALKTLKVFAYADADEEVATEARGGLDTFLSSFNSLETLEVKGYICSVSAIGHHRNLSTLCLHEDERSTTRRVLTLDDFLYLDQHCPGLTSLMVDVDRGEGELDKNAILTLSTGFRNLKELSIHLELGLKDYYHPIMPLLNTETAQNISKDIFERREQAGHYQYTLRLWTGSSYRRWPQREPEFVRFERLFTTRYTLQHGEGLKEKFENINPDPELFQDMDDYINPDL